MGASIVQEKGTAIVTDDVTDDSEKDDNDLMERLARREMMIDMLRVVRSDGNATVDAIYEVVQDAWIEGCRYGSGIKEPGPAELEVLLRRAEG